MSATLATSALRRLVVKSALAGAVATATIGGAGLLVSGVLDDVFPGSIPENRPFLIVVDELSPVGAILSTVELIRCDAMSYNPFSPILTLHCGIDTTLFIDGFEDP